MLLCKAKEIRVTDVVDDTAQWAPLPRVMRQQCGHSCMWGAGAGGVAEGVAIRDPQYQLYQHGFRHGLSGPTATRKAEFADATG